jgi:hypothetical protein
MPKLEVLEIWNATFTYGGEFPGKDWEGAACAFKYVYSSKTPKITFTSNWFREKPHAFGNDMEYCWANLPRHGPGNQLTIAIEGLPGASSWIKHSRNAMRMLDVRGFRVNNSSSNINNPR